MGLEKVSPFKCMAIVGIYLRFLRCNIYAKTHIFWEGSIQATWPSIHKTCPSKPLQRDRCDRDATRPPMHQTAKALSDAAMVALEESFTVEMLVQCSEKLRWFGGFLKWWYPQFIHFNGFFHYKPSILGYPNFRKLPFTPRKIFHGTW